MTKSRIIQRRLLTVLATLPLLVATAILVLYLVLDFDTLRDSLVAELGTLTGRDVTIEGDVKLALSLNPTLVVEGVAFGNADWGSRAKMLRIGRLEGQLSLLPLLSGDIQIRRLDLSDTELLLETDPLGRGNWLLSDSENADPAAEVPIPRIHELSFANLRLIWRNGESGDSTTLALGSMNVSGIGAEDFVRIAAASHDDADSTTSTWSLRLRLAATENGYSINGLALLTGKSDVSGNLDIILAHGEQHLTGQLSSAHFGISDFAGIITSSDRINRAASVDVERTGRIFSQKPFGIEIPRSLKAGLSLQVQRFDTPPLALQNLSAQVSVDHGVLSIDGLKAKLDGAHLTAGLVFDTTREPPVVKARLSGEDVRFGKLVRAPDGGQWLDSKGDLRFQVQGSGRSMAAVMANLSGTARLLVGKGRIDAREVDALISSLNVALETLTDQDADQTRLNCIASSFKIDKGVASSQLLLADTEYSTVYGEGSIDLRSERLDLLLKPKPKSTSINVAVPVEIGGTLAAPTFSPEKFTTARKGVGVLAAVGFISFPPAILLGLGELGSGDANPCLKASAATRHAQAGRKPSEKPGKGLIERTTDSVTTALDGVGSRIKGLFN